MLLLVCGNIIGTHGRTIYLAVLPKRHFVNGSCGSLIKMNEVWPEYQGSTKKIRNPTAGFRIFIYNYVLILSDSTRPLFVWLMFQQIIIYLLHYFFTILELFCC